MVYLRSADTGWHIDKNWLCGGVIIDESYILTSAACIEDIKNFYVVIGTHKWIPAHQTNECIRNGAMRAVWKCVPKTYRYDGLVSNNIRWMVNDIAVVMTEDQISFHRKVKGCDFIPKKIAYNNISLDLERPGTKGFLAGWGSTDKYTEAADVLARSRQSNSPILQETETIIINKAACKQRWVSRYHSIIEWYMICGKTIPRPQTSQTCDDEHVACRQLVFSEEEGSEYNKGKNQQDDDKMLVEAAAHVQKIVENPQTRRDALGRTGFGGFCENDHGGPLIVGRGKSVVVGVISAYRVQNNSKQCFGPFLYTSVYNNRHLIECAVFKGAGVDCSHIIRDANTILEEETMDWGNYPVRARAIYEDDEKDVDAGKPKAVNGPPPQ